MESEWSRSFEAPDEVIEDPKVLEEVVHLGGVTVGRYTIEPGWKWSTHVKPRVGTDLCEARHVGVNVRGRVVVRLSDSTEYLIEPGDVFVIPPGHDIWVEGDEPAVSIEWAGALAWQPGPEGAGERLLATMLMSDIVGSTVEAERLGAERWKGLLRAHDDTTADVVNRFHGRVIKGTGDGALALFQSARNAVEAATALCDEIEQLGISVRVGIHTGEVDLVNDDVHGLTVHELARITDLAEGNQVLVSATTATLAANSKAEFVSKGAHQLRGVTANQELFAVT